MKKSISLLLVAAMVASAPLFAEIKLSTELGFGNVLLKDYAFADPAKKSDIKSPAQGYLTLPKVEVTAAPVENWEFGLIATVSKITFNHYGDWVTKPDGSITITYTGVENLKIFNIFSTGKQGDVAATFAPGAQYTLGDTGLKLKLTLPVALPGHPEIPIPGAWGIGVVPRVDFATGGFSAAVEFRSMPISYTTPDGTNSDGWARVKQSEAKSDNITKIVAAAAYDLKDAGVPVKIEAEIGVNLFGSDEAKKNPLMYVTPKATFTATDTFNAFVSAKIGNIGGNKDLDSEKKKLSLEPKLGATVIIK